MGDSQGDITADYSFDPFCDPNNPVIIPFQEISAAAYKIKSGIERTPCSVSMLNVKWHVML